MARVSERSRFDATDNRLASVRNVLDQAQQTALSGRKLRRLSDDPAGALRAFRNRAKLDNVQQFRKTLDFAKGYLAKTEDALLGIGEALSRAKELAIQQANSTWDGAVRATVAEEVHQLAKHIAVLGNSTYEDKYVFGGFRTHLPPVGADGTYQGDDGVLFVQVDEGSFRPVNVSGRAVFEVRADFEGEDKPLLGVLREMEEALRSNNLDELHVSMSDLDRAFERVNLMTASLGARTSAVNDVLSRLDSSEEALVTDNNHLESADPVKMAMDLQRAEQALNFAIQSSGKILKPTLLNFLT